MTDLSVQIKHRLSADVPNAAVVGDLPIRARVSLRRFYQQRGYRPAWQGEGNELLLNELMLAIQQASQHGLTPTDYHQTELLSAIVAEDVLSAELLATDAYLTLAAHLLGGRLDPVSIESNWTAMRRERDLVEHLQAALPERRILDSLYELQPNAPGYTVLMQALATYRQAEQVGGWDKIPDGPKMRLGDVGDRVAILRQRLHASGLLKVEQPDTDRFDYDLENAVAAFQRRIGIESDGVVGPQTLAELNKGAAQRVAQLRANLERWRWLPEKLGERHIRVNIADYRLEVRNQGQIERVHDVIVGRTYRKTPVFSDEVAYVVLNPWWETPSSLARLDKLPAFKKDPSQVERLGFQVLDKSGKAIDASRLDWGQYNSNHFPYRLRQRPGPENALGRVKLMFPNKHNVYLHDTPASELFLRSRRDFSSGCVRVADAIGLTEWVLQTTPGWPRDKIDTVLASGRETRIDLSKKLPVHILYFTVVAESDGTWRMLNDVYDRDARVITALDVVPVNR